MITIILLIIIYLAFISLGLPDSILGTAIPSMQNEWNIPLSLGGVVSFVIICGSVVSSFSSGYIQKHLKTGWIIFISCVLTGSALMGFSYSPSFIWLLLFALPLGLGGGAVDAALNSYVALNFKARHMNWLHSFWGVGATLGPLIMSWTMHVSGSWRLGYRSISFIQLILANILFFTLPIWRLYKPVTGSDTPDNTKNIELPILKIPGVVYALATMLFYCAVELGTGLWASSFLVKVKKLSVESAAGWVAMYYAGITIGRFFSGFLSIRFTNKQMIRYGNMTAIAGILLMLLPLPQVLLGLALIIIGLGLSPIFPAMIHATPDRFGKDNATKIIGFQMGFAYIGSAALAPMLGVLYQVTNIAIFPVTIAVLSILLFTSSEIINKILVEKRKIP